MAALDFPASPTVGQTHPGPGGVLWSWDGAKWANGLTSVGSGVSSWNARIGAVTQTSADVTTALTYTPYNSTNPAGYQTATQVTAVIPGISYADNGGFAINQRAYVSGAALAAGAFGHDRWKAGAGGATYTFTQSGNPATTITITAGTLQQVVEGVALVGGNYTLSWSGTALGRISSGAYIASPVVTSGVAAGVNTTIEFGTGTLGRVKFEAGTVVTPWQALPAQQELANCQRFYQTGQLYAQNVATAAGQQVAHSSLCPVTMRANATMTITNNASSNLNTVTIAHNGNMFSTTGMSTAITSVTLNVVFTASADL